MIRIIVAPDDPDPRAIAQAVEVLAAGGVIAFPTDTLYGLAVDPRSDDAVEKLLALKGRDRTAALPLVAADVSQARTAGQFGPLASCALRPRSGQGRCPLSSRRVPWSRARRSVEGRRLRSVFRRTRSPARWRPPSGSA